MYFSSKLNIVDACIVVITLGVSIVYTILDLIGDRNNHRYTLVGSDSAGLCCLRSLRKMVHGVPPSPPSDGDAVFLRVLVNTTSRDVLVWEGLDKDSSNFKTVDSLGRFTGVDF